MPPNAARRIGLAGAHVRLGDRRAGRGAARVGVLDDDGGRLVELERRCAPPRRGRAGWCTTAPCPGARSAAPRPCAPTAGVPGGRLVRVLAVAQVAHLAKAQHETRGSASPAARGRARSRRSSNAIVAQRRRDRGVVGGGVGERLARQFEAERQRRPSAARARRAPPRSRPGRRPPARRGSSSRPPGPCSGPPMSISSTRCVERRVAGWRPPSRTDTGSRRRGR